jgi:hypothetical protein
MNGTESIRDGETAIDRLTLAAAGTSRRTVLQGLAATLLAPLGGGIATTQAKQKRGKKAHRKPRKIKHKAAQKTPPTPAPTTPPPPPAKTCTPGTSIARVSVMADGSEVATPVLEDGVDYVLRPSGFWSTSNDRLQDAFASFTFADPFSPRLFDHGVRTGLLLDGLLPDIWEAYQPNHSYGIVVIGKGKPVRFRMLDFDYTGNSGVVHVDVTCAVQRQS